MPPLFSLSRVLGCLAYESLLGLGSHLCVPCVPRGLHLSGTCRWEAFTRNRRNQGVSASQQPRRPCNQLSGSNSRCFKCQRLVLLLVGPWLVQLSRLTRDLAGGGSVPSRAREAPHRPVSPAKPRPESAPGPSRVLSDSLDPPPRGPPPVAVWWPFVPRLTL